MSRNWTDYPLNGAIPRKKVHITELHDAYDERHGFIHSCPGLDGRITLATPTWWYRHKTSAPTAYEQWGDYPKADPVHWPPNESPDNEFRNEHIYDVRALLRGSTGYGAHAIVESSYVDSEFNMAFTRPGSSTNLSYSSVDSNLLVDAFGSSEFTNATLTAGSLDVYAAHVGELRAVVEKLVLVREINYDWDVRYRKGEGSSDTSMAAAWSAAMSDYDGNSWSAWGGSISTPLDLPNQPIGLAAQCKDNGAGNSPRYQVAIRALQAKYFFDLSSLSLGVTASRLLVRNLATGGNYGDHGIMAGFSLDAGSSWDSAALDNNGGWIEALDDASDLIGESGVEVIVGSDTSDGEYSTTQRNLLYSATSATKLEGYLWDSSPDPGDSDVIIEMEPNWAHGRA